MEKNFVPLNSSTINGLTAPIAQTYPYDVICPIDGWYWNNNIDDDYIDTKSSHIRWTIYPKNDNNANIQFNPYINRIYFNVYLYKIDSSTMSTIPTLNIKFASGSTPFTGFVTFKYTSTALTTAGLYTFVADMSTTASTTANYGRIYNKGGSVRSLAFSSSTPSGQTFNNVYATTEMIENIFIGTESGSKYKFILSNICVEVNNHTNAFGGATNSNAYSGAGVSNYVFSSSCVKELYYERALTRLYINLYRKPIAKVVTPLFNDPNALSTSPLIQDEPPTPEL
jgi:hypothetical protein